MTDFLLALENTDRALSQNEYIQAYLTTKEAKWSSATIDQLEAVEREVQRRGLRDHLRDQIGELHLPHERWLVKKYSETSSELESTNTGSSASPPTTVDLEKLKGRLLPSASMTSGDPSTDSADVLDAAQVKPSAQPSIEEPSGAQNGAVNGFGVEAYLRLPLPGRRDAFVHDGMLYVRRSVLRQWFQNFQVGKCCPPQREGRKVHASTCWIHQDNRDAVR